MSDVVIFGAGDIARLAHFYFTHDSDRKVAAFAVDAEFRSADSFLDLPLVAVDDLPRLFPPGRVDAFVALSYAGMNALRRAKFEMVRRLGYACATYVSSRCSYLAKDPPGANCFILEDNTVQPFVRIGDNVTLWSGNHIGHDSTIGDHCFISSHVVISGHVTIGEACFIGVNATLRNSIRIADRTLIGAGAVIMKDTEPDSAYLGTRAQKFPKRSDQIDL
ncbi:MAG TPA: acetyltransferase [Vicinamibacterales bacterium]|jgi:sugar O-acyltransferase (sialic acid O-acetyltransferase NeuD family)